jgi:hypothetical protein
VRKRFDVFDTTHGLVLVVLVFNFPCHVFKLWRVWGEDRCVYRVLVGKPEGKRPLGRPRRRWEDNIKMDLQEVGRGSWGLDGVGSG